ncbi:hypothetical protein FHS40_007968 [Streptomyces spectabilis]|uniref:Uncharacterized protein n=1 Tax=Streptomyces spectabilis TaxID=68270 RepID=A0A7W8B2K5_STRST|nr:hypothetical protein [Streptomyces spectabilis]
MVLGAQQVNERPEGLLAGVLKLLGAMSLE